MKVGAAAAVLCTVALLVVAAEAVPTKESGKSPELKAVLARMPAGFMQQFGRDRMIRREAVSDLPLQLITNENTLIYNGKSYSLDNLAEFLPYAKDFTKTVNGLPVSATANGTFVLRKGDGIIAEYDERGRFSRASIHLESGLVEFIAVNQDLFPGLVTIIVPESIDVGGLQEFHMDAIERDSGAVVRMKSEVRDIAAREIAARKGLNRQADGTRYVEIAIAYDNSFCARYSSESAATAEVNRIVADVSVMYERDVNTVLVLTHIEAHCNDPVDPYDPSVRDSGCQPGGGLLQLFNRIWSNGDRRFIRRDIAQLFTGRDMTGGTIGCAYLYQACGGNPGGDAVNQMTYAPIGSVTHRVLFAHELGHNCGARHCSCPQYTMNPYITQFLRFSEATQNDVIGYIGSPGCWNSLDPCNDLVCAPQASCVRGKCQCPPGFFGDANVQCFPSASPLPSTAPTASPTPVPTPQSCAPGAENLKDAEIFELMVTNKQSIGTCRVIDQRGRGGQCDFYFVSGDNRFPTNPPRYSASGCVKAPEFPKQVDYCYNRFGVGLTDEEWTSICTESGVTNIAQTLRLALGKGGCCPVSQTPMPDIPSTCELETADLTDDDLFHILVERQESIGSCKVYDQRGKSGVCDFYFGADGGRFPSTLSGEGTGCVMAPNFPKGVNTCYYKNPAYDLGVLEYSNLCTPSGKSNIAAHFRLALKSGKCCDIETPTPQPSLVPPPCDLGAQDLTDAALFHILVENQQKIGTCSVFDNRGKGGVCDFYFSTGGPNGEERYPRTVPDGAGTGCIKAPDFGKGQSRCYYNDIAYALIGHDWSPLCTDSGVANVAATLRLAVEKGECCELPIPPSPRPRISPPPCGLAAAEYTDKALYEVLVDQGNKIGTCGVVDQRSGSGVCDFYFESGEGRFPRTTTGSGTGCVKAPDFRKSASACYYSSSAYSLTPEEFSPLCTNSGVSNIAGHFRLALSKNECCPIPPNNGPPGCSRNSASLSDEAIFTALVVNKQSIGACRVIDSRGTGSACDYYFVAGNLRYPQNTFKTGDGCVKSPESPQEVSSCMYAGWEFGLNVEEYRQICTSSGITNVAGHFRLALREGLCCDLGPLE
mmetsp:Transcript_3566/g.9922  ORF Transcript_3566/g.9922 Transcript_3566/m.9922 type:complete len:1103 (-) Transcript_3566:305-3613(-)